MMRVIVNSAIRDNYARLNVIWTEGLIETMTNFRPTFGNDMDKVVVLAVIGQCAQRLVRANSTYEQALQSENWRVPDNALTNVQSITDSTGIPRESVRRKVNELIALGWVERLEDGSLRIVGSRVANQIRPVTERQFEIIDKTISAMISELEAMRVLKVLSVTSTRPAEDEGGRERKVCAQLG
jgi:hypothetical protein